MSVGAPRRKADALRRTLLYLTAAAAVDAVSACAEATPQTPTVAPPTATRTEKPTRPPVPAASPRPTQGKNFTPSISLTPTEVIVPEILAAGTFTLTAWNWDEDSEYNSFDLDQAVKTGSGNADFQYSVGCGSQCFDSLSVVDGATQFDLGDLPADSNTCIIHQPEFTSDGLFGWGAHNFYCIRTNGGNMSLVTVADIPDTSGKWRLQKNFLTWDMDSPG
jgi:hypothetical protein